MASITNKNRLAALESGNAGKDIAQLESEYLKKIQVRSSISGKALNESEYLKALQASIKTNSTTKGGKKNDQK